MIELIYFGMMPVLTLIAMIVHKLGYADMKEQFGGDNIVIGYSLVMIFWPLVLLVFIVLGILYTVYLVLDVISDLIIDFFIGKEDK